MDMNRLITVVTKGIGSIRQAIVNYMSQPKEVHAAASTIIVDRTDEEETERVIPKDSVHFLDSDKGPVNIQKQTTGESISFSEYVKVVKEAVENAMRSIESKSNYSINRKLSYNKKKTQRRNWSKWKRRNR